MATSTRPAPSPSTIRRHVIWNASIVALGGLLFGYDTGVISGALLFIGKDFTGMSSTEKELLTSILLIGAVLGALFVGRVADRIGRRPTVLATAAIFVVGVLLAAFSPSYGVLLVARVVIGVAVGSSSMVVPLYIGETAPPRIRGALVSFNQLAITSGILVSYLVDYGLTSSQNWRLMFGLATIPAALLFVGMLFQRESPHWLIAQGREDEARAVLVRIRDSSDIDAEITQVREMSSRTSSVRELLDPKTRQRRVRLLPQRALHRPRDQAARRLRRPAVADRTRVRDLRRPQPGRRRGATRTRVGTGQGVGAGARAARDHHGEPVHRPQPRHGGVCRGHEQSGLPDLGPRPALLQPVPDGLHPPIRHERRTVLLRARRPPRLRNEVQLYYRQSI